MAIANLEVFSFDLESGDAGCAIKELMGSAPDLIQQSKEYDDLGQSATSRNEENFKCC